MSYDEFVSNQDVMDICAVQCQIIGNSAGSVSDRLKNDHPEINWRGMYGARCIISHGYGLNSYDMRQLWKIISVEVEKTLRACEHILEHNI